MQKNEIVVLFFGQTSLDNTTKLKTSKTTSMTINRKQVDIFVLSQGFKMTVLLTNCILTINGTEVENLNLQTNIVVYRIAIIWTKNV